MAPPPFLHHPPPPRFQVYPPFVANIFVPPLPSDSLFGRSYSPFIRRGGSNYVTCYQLLLIVEFAPEMKCLCFHVMFLSKINQVILVSILFFSGFEVIVTNDLCDILLSLIPFWSDCLSSR